MESLVGGMAHRHRDQPEAGAQVKPREGEDFGGHALGEFDFLDEKIPLIPADGEVGKVQR